MRRKQQVQTKLEAIINRLELNVRALEGRQLSADQLLINLKSILGQAKHTEELVDLED